MSYLPPVGWADVATKHDVQALGTELRSEMTTFRAELRLEMAELSGSFRGEMAGLRVDIERSFNHQLRSIIGAMVALTAIFGTISTIVAVFG